MSDNTELRKQDNLPVGAEDEMFGFEEARQEDNVIPRIKVVNALSPERKEKLAEEGDLVNSLSREVIPAGSRFIPVKMYYSNIWWNPERGDDQRMFCRSADGRIGVPADGGSLVCESCKNNQFDNTKQGKEAQPECTMYMNFLGFFVGNPSPVVLSFAKTNYNEGKKLYSMAKSMMKSIWTYNYELSSKMVSKNGNEWYIITAKMGTENTPEDKAFATNLYKVFEKVMLNVDYEDTAAFAGTSNVDEQTAAEI